DGAPLAELLETLGDRQLVVERLLRRPRPLEEKEPGLHIRVRCEGAGRQAHYCVQVEVTQDVRLDRSESTTTKTRPLGHNHASARQPAAPQAGWYTGSPSAGFTTCTMKRISGGGV